MPVCKCMALPVEAPQKSNVPSVSVLSDWLRFAMLIFGGVLIGYLCWLIVKPFLTALCWALALAVIADPIKCWMLRKSIPRSVAALLLIVLVLTVVIGPCVLLTKAMLSEATEFVNHATSEAGSAKIRESIANNKFLGSVLGWLNARVDLPDEAIQLVRSAAKWASSGLTAFLSGSMWLLTQIGVMLFVLFYFLRDTDMILARLRAVLPIAPSQLDAVFARVAQILRVSLGGKIVVSTIQGSLGGLMFYWLGLPAPVFWGIVMSVLSIVPVLGSFVVWGPATLVLVLQGAWQQALLLTVWGVVIISPVDNLLGPVLVGATLRLHTLLMFFSVIGGIAAFGAPGIVLGPVTLAIAVALFELNENESGTEPA